jgi:hypothetical protein
LEGGPNANVLLRQCIDERLGHSLPPVLASSREANRIRQSTARPKVHAGCPLRWVFRPHRWGVISRLDFVSQTCHGEVGFTFRAYNEPPRAVQRDPVERTAPKGQQRAAGRLRESRHKAEIHLVDDDEDVRFWARWVDGTADLDIDDKLLIDNNITDQKN